MRPPRRTPPPSLFSVSANADRGLRELAPALPSPLVAARFSAADSLVSAGTLACAFGLRFTEIALRERRLDAALLFLRVAAGVGPHLLAFSSSANADLGLRRQGAVRVAPPLCLIHWGNCYVDADCTRGWNGAPLTNPRRPELSGRTPRTPSATTPHHKIALDKRLAIC